MMNIKIRHKLFFTLLASSAIVAGGLFFFLQWNFDRGFLNYVKKQELEQLEQLSEVLAAWYVDNDQHDWSALKNNHRLWIKMYEKVFFATHPRRERRPAVPDDLPPRDKPENRGEKRQPHFKSIPFDENGTPFVKPMDSRIIGPRILLFDQEEHWVIGGRPDERGRHLAKDGMALPKYPLYSGETVIGYLSLIPPSELSDSGDLLFVKEQTNAFMMVALIMLTGSIILTFPLTVHLLKPIKRLTRGTRKLIRGEFAARIPVHTSDELGVLSDHFNILATTLEKNEMARKQWVADISHELRTPLSVLRGGIEAIQDGVREPNANNIGVIHEEVVHLERLVADLYELSMSDIGALTYKKNSLVITDIVQSTINQFKTRFADKGIRVSMSLEDGLPSVLGDSDRLKQLFVNLLENSLKYTDDFGDLQVTACLCDESIHIIFEDSSPGVNDEQLPFLFERLFRTDSSRNRKRYGAGLGLTIAKNIVEAHRGSIHAATSELGGLKVSVALLLLDSDQ